MQKTKLLGGWAWLAVATEYRERGYVCSQVYNIVLWMDFEASSQKSESQKAKAAIIRSIFRDTLNLVGYEFFSF